MPLNSCTPVFCCCCCFLFEKKNYWIMQWLHCLRFYLFFFLYVHFILSFSIFFLLKSHLMLCFFVITSPSFKQSILQICCLSHFALDYKCKTLNLIDRQNKWWNFIMPIVKIENIFLFVFVAIFVLFFFSFEIQANEVNIIEWMAL